MGNGRRGATRMLCNLFANAQKALVPDKDTSMFPYHFVIVKDLVSFLDKTDVPVMTVTFHHFYIFTAHGRSSN